MGFEEGYTRKNLLRKRVEETSFNNLVRKLAKQKHITKSEAEKIAWDRLKERRYNALKVEDYISTGRQHREEKRLAGIRRAQTLKAEIRKKKIAEKKREKTRRSIKVAKQRKLEEKYKTQLIQEAMRAIPRQTDVIGRDLARFEGRINEFLETLKYGMPTAEKLTGKPVRMIKAEKKGILVKLSNWAKTRWKYMSLKQRKKFQNLVKRISK